ncbi:Eco57I restriction-modification methylase domain-containing protein [Herbaspirillum robiniae]|uniref:Eco57I restriction-modification methylase domain-containing protein n=1 Tax=Herbaspirillum robiniae TaxID=2014887 RepID=UPI003D780B87
MQRVHALKKSVDKWKDGPSQAVKTLLFIWQKEHFPLLCSELSEVDFPLAQDKAIRELASWLKLRPFLESAFWLSSAYAIWVGDGTRSEKSLYFTPPILADRLIDDLIAHGASLTDHVWMDPACGGGAFLAPVAVRMIQAMDALGLNSLEILARVSENLVGNDIDETLGYLSSQFLLMALYSKIEDSSTLPDIEISIGDGLLASACNSIQADVVICNPPYRKMKSLEVSQYADSFADVIEGQPNIYALFIRQCLKLGKEHAVIGLLTPTSYLSGRYFSKLRRTVLSEATVRQLDMVDDRVGVFIGVSQGAVLSVFKRSPRKANTFQTKVFGLSITGTFTAIGKCSLNGCVGAWPIPRELGDEEIIQRAAASPFRLKDYGYTARVGTYVDYRDTRKTYTKKPDNKKMKAVFPLLWSSDITTDGVVVHGRTSKEDGHHTFIEMGSVDHQAIIRRPAIALQRVTSPDQPRRLVCAPIDSEFLEIHGGVVGENHVIFLERTTEEALLSPTELASILASDSIDRLFRSISGAVNVSVSELNQITLPNPSVLARLIRSGRTTNDAITESFKFNH